MTLLTGISCLTLWRLSFPGLYVHWIKQCATSSRLSVVIDGSLHGYFPRKRGLRQGDPLSPYLFLLVMQAFTALLVYRVDTEAFTYHPRCSGVKLPHLIFADDMFILCDASPQSFNLVIRTLKESYSYSGLQPSLSKNTIFYADVPSDLKIQLNQIFAIPRRYSSC